MENTKPAKFDGEVVGVAKFKDDEIVITLNDSDKAEKIWAMLNDDTLGYSLEDEGYEEDEDDLTFQQALAQVINRHSREQPSNTPDFVLASYLEGCLESYERAVKWRGDLRGEAPSTNHAPAILDEVFPDAKDGEVRLVSWGYSDKGLGYITHIDGVPIENSKSIND